MRLGNDFENHRSQNRVSNTPKILSTQVCHLRTLTEEIAMNSNDNPDSKTVPHEPDAHVVARRFRTGVRLLLALSLIATVVCLFFLQDAAYLAAIPIPILYAVLALTNYLEIRSRASNLRSPGESGIGRQEMQIDIQTVGIVTLLKVLGVLAVGTFIIAASFFDWRIVGAAAAALFFLIILIQIPYLPLYFSESERDERDRLRSQQRRKPTAGGPESS